MQHRECTPVVTSRADDMLGEKIHITFQGHTLCLDETKASWLAANIQREIRELQRRKVLKATPLTVEQKRQLRVGDMVVVRADDGEEFDYEVKAEPWQLGHGAWVIGLRGISGGYDLSRVTGIISTVHSRGDAVHAAS